MLGELSKLKASEIPLRASGGSFWRFWDSFLGGPFGGNKFHMRYGALFTENGSLASWIPVQTMPADTPHVGLKPLGTKQNNWHAGSLGEDCSDIEQQLLLLLESCDQIPKGSETLLAPSGMVRNKL